MPWLFRYFKRPRSKLVPKVLGKEVAAVLTTPEVEVEVKVTAEIKAEESPLCSICRLALQKLANLGLREEKFVTKIRLEPRAELGCHLCGLFLHIIRKVEPTALYEEYQLVYTPLPTWASNRTTKPEIRLEVLTGSVMAKVERQLFSYSTSPRRYRLTGRLADPIDHSIEEKETSLKIPKQLASFDAELFSSTIDSDIICSETASGTAVGVKSLIYSRAWVRECRDQHKLCKKAKTNFTPTRLIMVGNQNPPKPRLHVHSKLLSTPLEYLTLSHCWGENMPVKLTKDSLTAMSISINYDRLPKSFREAIQITQQLRMDYLWIDSLCIVQDSDEDWQRESALMDQVYANAVCNVSAASAENSSGGLFFDRDPAVVQPLRCRMDGFGMMEFWEANISQNLEAFYLSRRAWCVQERILSRANLYFAKDQLYWECCEARASERFPRGLPSDENPGRGYIKRRFAESSKDNVKVSMKSTWDQKNPQDMDVWRCLVELYTQGKLTYEKDRLVALAGMATRLQRAYQSTYLAGIWQQNIFHQLCWHPAQLKIPSGIRSPAPSWSWASFPGAVLSVVEGLQWPKSHNIAEFVDANVDLVSNNKMGQVKGGQLLVKGRLALAEKRHGPRIPPDLIMRFGADSELLSEDDLRNVEFHQYWSICEADQSNVQSRPIVILPLLYSDATTEETDQYPGDPSIRGILLTVSEREPLRFERCGSFRLSLNGYPSEEQALKRRDLEALLDKAHSYFDDTTNEPGLEVDREGEHPQYVVTII